MSFLKRWFSAIRGREEQSFKLQGELYTETPPQQLGIHPWIAELPELVRSLEHALDQEWLEHVKRRVMDAYPVDDAKYEWMLFELKRFFILCVVMKNVPMYSEEVDRIWHEMLLHTREYEKFCMQFAGQFIHHQPNIADRQERHSDIGEQRALHDLVYSLLFEIHPQNEMLLRPFFRFNVNDNVFTTLALDHNEPAIDQNESAFDRYFNGNANEMVRAVQLRLIELVEDKYRESKNVDMSPDDAARLAALKSRRSNERSPYAVAEVDPLMTVMLLSSASNLTAKQRNNSGGSSCYAAPPHHTASKLESGSESGKGSGPGSGSGNSSGTGPGSSAGGEGGSSDSSSCGGGCGGCSS